jgi:hypothetical protein
MSEITTKTLFENIESGVIMKKDKKRKIND